MTLWNNRRSWCVQSGAPCIGCCEANPNDPGHNWVEVNTPFYKRHRDLRIGDWMVQPGTIALGITGIVAAALVVHGFGMKLTGRMDGGADFEKVREWDAKHPDRRSAPTPHGRRRPVRDELLQRTRTYNDKKEVSYMTRSVIDPDYPYRGPPPRRDGGRPTARSPTPGCPAAASAAWSWSCENRTPEDAAQIVQRICGVCPVSHAHSSAIAAEKAYGIKISNNARIIRNLLEGAQFLHSHILWFYNLAALDYVNPLNALKADAADAYDLALAQAACTPNSDFVALKERLANFADNGQLSIFSGNWFDAEDGTAYKLPPELDLICTAHYLEALQMQAKASQMSRYHRRQDAARHDAHPGRHGVRAHRAEARRLCSLADEIYDWVERHDDPRHACHRAVLHRRAQLGQGLRPLRGLGRVRGPEALRELHRADATATCPWASSTTSSTSPTCRRSSSPSTWAAPGTRASETYTSPYFVTEPEFTEYNVDDRYTWVKCPAYDGKPYEAGGLSRVLAAYKRNVPFIVEQVDGLLERSAPPGRSAWRSPRSAAPPSARSRRSTSPAS